MGELMLRKLSLKRDHQILIDIFLLNLGSTHFHKRVLLLTLILKFLLLCNLTRVKYELVESLISFGVSRET